MFLAATELIILIILENVLKFKAFLKIACTHKNRLLFAALS